MIRDRIQRDVEARKARRRLYPVTVLYTAYALAMLWFGLRSAHPAVAAGFFTLGVAIWTLTEYLVHRYILHGRFPDGDGVLKHFMHRHFDHLHLAHHERPWDGNHINGTVSDTLPFLSVVIGAGLLLPSYTLSMWVAGLMQSYVVEEWVHHSVHFCRFRNPYFRYIKRHHLYHHSPKGSDVGYGLSNGIWDVVLDTRIPTPIRHALYGPHLEKIRGPLPAARRV